MALSQYRKKRNFTLTAEPRGTIESSQSKKLYIIQKHAASHLHYDFRLEINGVLKSWAVPKGPSLDPQVKRLAVQVEDHPLSYGSFEGIIPKGQYGGGSVLLWDQGTWEPEESAIKAYRNGHLVFTLKGKKLKGRWSLIQIKNNPQNWLLIKINDRWAQSSKEVDILEKKPRSVLTRRSIDEITTEEVSSSRQKRRSKMNKKDQFPPLQKGKPQQKFLKKAKRSKIPTYVSPQLATLVKDPPTGDQWLHEIKFDGYRLLCFMQNKKIEFFTRRNNNWTHLFPDLVKALKKLKIHSALFDGEVVVLNKEGRSDFQLLQNALHQQSSNSLIYYIFDLLYWDHFDLRQLPLIQRKQLLNKVISTTRGPIRYTKHILGNGLEVFKKSCALHLEGIVSKQIDSHYTQKRSRQWLKSKCVKRQEFVVGGYTQPRGSRSYFGSLLIGVFSGQKKLQYCGHVGTGFNEASLKLVFRKLQKLITANMPFVSRPSLINQPQWVKPKLIVEVEFSEWTQEGILRAPSFKGLREDKPAKEVHIEIPLSNSAAYFRDSLASEFRGHTEERGEQATRRGLAERLSHPDRILYPEAKVTKLDLANYYAEVQSWLLPHLIKRPLTLLRCPGGYQTCFFQKHMGIHSSHSAIQTILIPENNGKEGEYAYVKNFKGLLELIQLGVLEIHTWGCHVDKIEKPDVMIFDLDPDPTVPWKKMVEGAHLMKEQLNRMKLKSFVKTSGGKGLHLVIPFRRGPSWERVKNFAQEFASLMAQQYPNRFIATMNKSKRKDKIFIDYVRNTRGATAVTPYSTRARMNAPISTPLSWEEVTPFIKPDTFTIKNIMHRLNHLKKDPWADYFNIKQSLN